MKWYAYLLVDPHTGLPFYVGKGQGDRILRHEREARRGARSYKCNKIRSIWRAGRAVERVKVFVTDDEQAALDLEILLIAGYRAQGVRLCNTTDGGQGMSNPAPETRAKLGAASAAGWQDATVRGRRVEGLKAYASSPQGRANLTKASRIGTNSPRHAPAVKASWQRPERRAVQSASLTRTLAQPEVRQRYSDAAIVASARPEVRARKSAVMHDRWQQPEYRAQQLAQLHSPEVRARSVAGRGGRKHTPEAKAKMAAAAQGRQVSTETRAKISAAARNISPETRAKMSEAAKRRAAKQRGEL